MLEWYPLHQEVEAVLGWRATTLFVHALSAQTDCLICSTFFQRWLIEAGDDPDAPQLNEREQVLVDFGRQLARDSNNVDDTLYAALAAFLSPDQIVTLTAFGALMIATNVCASSIKRRSFLAIKHG